MSWVKRAAALYEGMWEFPLKPFLKTKQYPGTGPFKIRSPLRANPFRTTAKAAGSAAWSVGKWGAQRSWSGAKYMVPKVGAAAKEIYGPTNAFTTKIFGASIPQMSAAVGLGLGAYALVSNDPVGGLKKAGQTGSEFYEMMRMESMTRQSPKSTRVYQQSVQGLVFGLNSRRTT